MLEFITRFIALGGAVVIGIALGYQSGYNNGVSYAFDKFNDLFSNMRKAGGEKADAEQKN